MIWTTVPSFTVSSKVRSLSPNQAHLSNSKPGLLTPEYLHLNIYKLYYLAITKLDVWVLNISLLDIYVWTEHKQIRYLI